MKRVRVNVRTVVNTAKVRKEQRNGRDVVVVPSATLPDNVVMNGIKYPADEIAASFASLERAPAPAGHPTVNGKFVSALDPEMQNIFGIGAWNENVTRKDGRVFLDKVIDVQRANQSEAGKAILNAIDKGEPIHTSTGLYCTLDAANEADGCKSVARNIVFDHDAILLNEAGAATPEQGVGMLVNSKGEAEEIEVINSAWDETERELDWAVDHLARALERRERLPMLERMKTALIEAFTPMREQTETNGKEELMDKEQFDALSAKVNALSEGFDKVGDTIANAVAEAVKPLVDHMTEVQNADKAKADAEKADLVNAVVKANLLTEAVANTLTVEALKELTPQTKPKQAAALNSAFTGADKAPAFKLPKGEEAA